MLRGPAEKDRTGTSRVVSHKLSESGVEAMLRAPKYPARYILSFNFMR